MLTGLAALAAGGTVLLPRTVRPAAEERLGLLALLRQRDVPQLLLICLAFMAAFHGVYAFIGEHVRATLDLPAGHAGLIVLTCGLGFGAAGLGDGWLDRLGPDRVFPFPLLAVTAVHGLMIPEPAAVPALAALSRRNARGSYRARGC